ncbi:MAG: recombination factor protein RarA, partial [Candidatus Competibacteraceae bacterium]|nr:recombination factor protein RarA [Candidatus Competibacteraceae bacterium]
LAQAVVYLACAAKSNAVYTAFKQAIHTVKNGGTLPVPEHLRNAPTALAKQMGHGKNYRYAHDEPGAFAAGATYFPNELGELEYYQPVERGLEIKIKQKLDYLRALNQSAAPKA